MKSKIYISMGTVMLVAGALVKGKALTIVGAAFVLVGIFLLVAVSSGIEFSESHYRFYRRIAFWKTGHWKSILGVRRIYIRHYTPSKKNSFWKSSSVSSKAQSVAYQVFFVRKSGYYKIFESDSIEIARQKAKTLSTKYNLIVKEKEKEMWKENKIETLLPLRAEKQFIPVVEEMA